jgi:hypothetical protein
MSVSRQKGVRPGKPELLRMKTREKTKCHFLIPKRDKGIGHLEDLCLPKQTPRTGDLQRIMLSFSYPLLPRPPVGKVVGKAFQSVPIKP